MSSSERKVSLPCLRIWFFHCKSQTFSQDTDIDMNQHIKLNAILPVLETSSSPQIQLVGLEGVLCLGEYSLFLNMILSVQTRIIES